VIQKVRRVIGRDIPILIHGETGVGKELLARAIHDDGPRYDKPFIAVNCAAIPEGLIESELFGYEEGAFTGAKRKGSCGKVLQADGGTLFLDEIGDMPHPLQARLLRVLQERLVNPLGSTKSIPVDIHLVCATHRKLKEAVAAGKFREDLYYRLNGLTVNLPALRVRSDLPALVSLILKCITTSEQRYQVADDVMEMFQRHPWPGNIRQLSNLLRTATVMAGEDEIIGVEHLPDDFLEDFDALATAPAANPPAPLREGPAVVTGAAPAGDNLPGMILSVSQNLESTTLNLIQRTLEQHQGNVSAAARQLGVSRNTLYRKLRQIWQV
jgi:transcriptional regulator with PAS, ATPase and Fis domain